ncbi:hypothetical protein EBU95_20925, partial [bacterium]|nr:hypothetical protein [bacterium]
SQIELFKSIKEGDIVLSPDKNSIHVGVVASDIYLTNDRYPNRIDVEWFDEIEKNPVVNQPKTVFKIKGFDFENLDFKSDTVVEDDGVELDKKMTFAEAAQVILKQNDNQPMSAREIWEEIEERDLVETSGATPWTTLNAKLLSLSDNSNVSHKQKRKLFHLVAENPAMFILIEPEQEIQPDDELDLDLPTKQSAFSLPDDEVLPFSHFRASQAQEERELKPSIMGLKRVKNPFGCKQEDGTETSTLCILGKSGSGKTTTTESALESMGHEYLLYIPIDGEYTFSQYTGSGFEMSSIGEFIMMAQNNPLKFYTVIFDECHRSITINKLNTDLLQSLSSKRNRGGERFFTMDMTTKRMYTTPIENFPVALVEKNGKVLVPDNFGIICLSSQPALICRNEDFVNRVDLVVFHKSDRGVDDLTILEKIDRNKFKTKDELLNYINAELLNE